MTACFILAGQRRRLTALLAAMAAVLALPSLPAFADEAPRTTREERYGNWGYSCAVAEDKMGAPRERCMISQLVASNPREHKVALGLVVDLYDSPTIPTLRARFSPGAERKVGIGMKIDDKPDLRLPISDCNKARCEATGRLTPQVLSLWNSGKQAQFAFLLKGGKQVVLPLSLNGFDRALAALRKHPGEHKTAMAPRS